MKSSSKSKRAHRISRITRKYLPIVEEFFRILPGECIKETYDDYDEKGYTIAFFPNEKGEEPWLEVCWFKKYKHQHVRLEVGKTENKHYNCFFEYEEFVTPENQDEILRNVLKYVLQVYGGTKIKDKSQIKRVYKAGNHGKKKNRKKEESKMEGEKRISNIQFFKELASSLWLEIKGDWHSFIGSIKFDLYGPDDVVKGLSPTLIGCVSEDNPFWRKRIKAARKKKEEEEKRKKEEQEKKREKWENRKKKIQKILFFFCRH